MRQAVPQRREASALPNPGMDVSAMGLGGNKKIVETWVGFNNN